MKFKQNFKKLESDLGLLDNRMREISKLVGTVKLIGSHSVYQNLSKEYRLNIESLHLEPDLMPVKVASYDFEDLLSKKDQTIMLWEAEPLPEISSNLMKIGVKVAIFDPCANIPKNGDFVTTMNKNIENVLKQ